MELEHVEHYERMDKVVQAMLKGTPPRQIAKQYGMKPVDVNRYISEWQSLARNNKYIQDRAKDALMATDQHYDMIISKLWDAVEETEMTGETKLKTSTLKTIADVEKARIEMLQKSGLLENQQIAEQVIETERKQEILVGILRKVAADHPDIAQFIRKELAKVTGVAEGTVVKSE